MRKDEKDLAERAPGGRCQRAACRWSTEQAGPPGRKSPGRLVGYPGPDDDRPPSTRPRAKQGEPGACWSAQLDASLVDAVHRRRRPGIMAAYWRLSGRSQPLRIAHWSAQAGTGGCGGRVQKVPGSSSLRNWSRPKEADPLTRRNRRPLRGVRTGLRRRCIDVGPRTPKKLDGLFRHRGGARPGSEHDPRSLHRLRPRPVPTRPAFAPWSPAGRPTVEATTRSTSTNSFGGPGSESRSKCCDAPNCPTGRLGPARTSA